MKLEPLFHSFVVTFKTTNDVNWAIQMNLTPFADVHRLEESRKTPEVIIVPMRDEDVVDTSDSFSLKLMFYVGAHIYYRGFFTKECKGGPCSPKARVLACLFAGGACTKEGWHRDCSPCP